MPVANSTAPAIHPPGITDAARNYKNQQSVATLTRGKEALAGGDSSTMRVLSYHLPLVASKGEGSRVWDVDGNEYIDLNMAFGPLLFGHRPKHIIDAVTRQIRDSGSMLGFPTEISMRVAEKIKSLFPSMELMRFANSGTEGIASAVRVARSYTGRRKVVLFEGHYHGWSEAVFHKYHAPISSLPQGDFQNVQPGTKGMSSAINEALLVPWNDIDALNTCLEKHGQDVAAVLMEPVMGNAGLILPKEGYLESVRAATHDHGALLIFDEVITGMRVAGGGAQEYFDVQPDITVISKALGGGYPVAAFGASKEIMSVIVNGTTFHGGVYSGNAAVMAAAEATLDEIIRRREHVYGTLKHVADHLAEGLDEICNRLRIPHVIHRLGGMLSLFLTKSDDVEDVYNYRDVREHGEFDKYVQLQHFMQQSGVYFHPNMFEQMFFSTVHTTQDMDAALERFEKGLKTCLRK